tara:strand:- start:86 stop:247 length:162 start_codon:yes stop_codon:yes gene_type:complete
MRVRELFEELLAILEVMKHHILKVERENKKLRNDIKKLQEDINSIIENYKQST